MSQKQNPFAIYATTEKKAVVDSLDGYEITYRELSMAESDAFNKRLLKGYTGVGTPIH